MQTLLTVDSCAMCAGYGLIYPTNADRTVLSPIFAINSRKINTLYFAENF